MHNQPSPILDIKNVDVSYGRVSVLHQVSLKVYEGQTVALLGANGAGKSTLLKAISGSLPFINGEILLKGKSLKGLPPQQIAKLGLVLVPEGRQIFREQTVEDNLQLGTYLRRNASRKELLKDREFIYELFPILHEKRKQIAGTLSGGQQQMLATGCGLMAKPKLLLLDEPSLGIAPLMIKELYRVLWQLKSQGLTILLVEQSANLALEMSDYVYVLTNGHVTVEGESQELRENEVIEEAYLDKKNVI
jgi:branched-chain amino acid transport system ATP-binding protein